MATATVDALLDAVDYTFPDYVPRVESVKYINFIKLVNRHKGGEENSSPVVHMKMLDSVFNRNKRSAEMCHRGIAKTTLFAEYLFLYIAVFGKIDGFGDINLALYVSDSIENGVKNLRKNIEWRYDDSPFLQEQVEIKFTDTRLEFKHKASGRKFIVKMYGAKTGVRGAKELGVRPQLAVLDDLISDEDARSDTIISSVEDTVHKAVSKALHPTKSKTIWLGTPFNQKDPLYKAVESGAWDVAVYPICEYFDANTTETTFRGSWEERFTFEYVKDEYESAAKQGKLEGFYQELMLRVISQEDRVIKDEDIVWYEFADLKDKIKSYNTYITTDFATSEKKSADFSAISVFGINNNGDHIWLDGICSRQLMNKNIEDLFRLVQIYKPLSVGVEVTGQQAGFIDWIHKEMIRRNVFFNIASDNNGGRDGIRPDKRKLERIMEIQPLFKQKKIWLPKDHRKECINEFMAEVRAVTSSGIKSKHDDMIDTFSMMAKMKVILPSVENEYVYDKASETWSQNSGGIRYVDSTVF
jgi:predicted phage terminase large subunit-like protein